MVFFSEKIPWKFSCFGGSPISGNLHRITDYIYIYTYTNQPLWVCSEVRGSFVTISCNLHGEDKTTGSGSKDVDSFRPEDWPPRPCLFQVEESQILGYPTYDVVWVIMSSRNFSKLHYFTTANQRSKACYLPKKWGCCSEIRMTLDGLQHREKSKE